MPLFRYPGFSLVNYQVNDLGINKAFLRNKYKSESVFPYTHVLCGKNRLVPIRRNRTNYRIGKGRFAATIDILRVLSYELCPEITTGRKHTDRENDYRNEKTILDPNHKHPSDQLSEPKVNA